MRAKKLYGWNIHPSSWAGLMFWKILQLKMISTVFLLIMINFGVFSGHQFLAISYAGDPAADDALDYLRSNQQTDGSIVDYGTSTWAVMAIRSAGESPGNWKAGGAIHCGLSDQ